MFSLAKSVQNLRKSVFKLLMDFEERKKKENKTTTKELKCLKANYG